MSDESSTASIARSVISEAGNSTPADVTTADHNQRFANAQPRAALRELFDLTGGETDQTRLEAAAAVQRTDKRPIEVTKGGLLRRAHDPNGSRTAEIAQEMIDLKAWGEANRVQIDPEDRRARTVEKFVRDMFREAGQEAPPEIQGRQLTPEAVNALLDLLIAQGRSSR